MELRTELFFIYTCTIIFSAILGAMLLSQISAAPQDWIDIIPQGQAVGPFEEAFTFFLYMMLGAVGFIIINKFGLVSYAIKAIELVSIFATFAISAIIIMQYLGLTEETASLIGYFIAIVFLVRRILAPMERNNLYGIVVSAVLGALFGIMLSIEAVIIFGILMAIYDVVAVFITKHMIDIAKVVVANNLSMVVTVSKGDVKPNFGTRKTIEKTRRLDLGTGDLFIAALFVVCALKYTPGLFITLFVFSLIGFIATMTLLSILRRPIPALPTIVGSILVGYCMYYLSFIVLNLLGIIV